MESDGRPDRDTKDPAALYSAKKGWNWGNAHLLSYELEGKSVFTST